MRAEFPNSEKLLRPGMFARVRVSLGLQANAIVVPQRAIIDLQGRTFAWVVSPDGKTTQRAVKLGETIASNVLVAEGLNAGERIVVEGLQKVREGQAVRIAAEKP
jgi:membrane fusion protein (multidrug efflux system)